MHQPIYEDPEIMYRVEVPTYNIGESIDWALKYAQDNRWDIVRRCKERLEREFNNVKESFSPELQAVLDDPLAQNLIGKHYNDHAR